MRSHMSLHLGDHEAAVRDPDLESLIEPLFGSHRAQSLRDRIDPNVCDPRIADARRICLLPATR
jgi:hypothetical protein